MTDLDPPNYGPPGPNILKRMDPLEPSLLKQLDPMNIVRPPVWCVFLKMS